MFQGTLLEDATAGTHVISLTVTPGAGNEIKLLGGYITVGTATASTVVARVTDGTNIVEHLYNAQGASGTTSGLVHSIPYTAGSWATPSGAWVGGGAATDIYISGAMQLVFQLTTTAVSVTHTFGMVLRVWGDSPTFTFNDTVGTPTPTTNTSGFF